MGQHDSQCRVAHARSAGSQENPLPNRPAAADVDFVGHGDSGNVGPLPVGTQVSLGDELRVGTGGGDADLGCPVGAPESVDRGDRGVDLGADARQQGFGARTAEVDQ